MTAVLLAITYTPIPPPTPCRSWAWAAAVWRVPPTWTAWPAASCSSSASSRVSPHPPHPLFPHPHLRRVRPHPRRLRHPRHPRHHPCSTLPRPGPHRLRHHHHRRRPPWRQRIWRVRMPQEPAASLVGRLAAWEAWATSRPWLLPQLQSGTCCNPHINYIVLDTMQCHYQVPLLCIKSYTN